MDTHRIRLHLTAARIAARAIPAECLPPDQVNRRPECLDLIDRALGDLSELALLRSREPLDTLGIVGPLDSARRRLDDSISSAIRTVRRDFGGPRY